MYVAPDSHQHTALNLLIKLQSAITNGNPELLSCLPHVNATLKKLLYTCNAASTLQSTNVDTSFEDKENFAPGKKMELQPRFTATASTPGRKRGKNTL